jgi:hypothetical protein
MCGSGLVTSELSFDMRLPVKPEAYCDAACWTESWITIRREAAIAAADVHGTAATLEDGVAWWPAVSFKAICWTFAWTCRRKQSDDAESVIFWVAVLCSPLKINQRFGRNYPPKRLLTCSGLHCVTRYILGHNHRHENLQFNDRRYKFGNGTWSERRLQQTANSSPHIPRRSPTSRQKHHQLSSQLKVGNELNEQSTCECNCYYYYCCCSGMSRSIYVA